MKLTMTCVLTFHSMFVALVTAEFFTSNEQMVDLVDTSLNLIKDLKEYIGVHDNRNEKALKYMLKMYVTNELAKSNPRSFMQNPLNAFMLVKHLTVDIEGLIYLLTMTNSLKEFLNGLKTKYAIPSLDDYYGIIDGITKMESTYLLNINDMIKGEWSKEFPSRKLSAHESFEIGKYAITKNNYYQAFTWLTTSLKQFDASNEENPLLGRAQILYVLANVTHHQGNKRHSLKLLKEILEKFPQNEEIEKRMDAIQKEINLDPDAHTDEIKNRKGPSSSEEDKYRTLCRGKKSLHLTLTKDLYCRHIVNNALFPLTPIKAEKIYDKPDMWLYYDFITDNEANFIKTWAIPKLYRSSNQTIVGGLYNETHPFSISKMAWIADYEAPAIFAQLNSRIGTVTQLDISSAEDLQVINFGVAGRAENHWDYFTEKNLEQDYATEFGNRLATFMIFLEEPVKGGVEIFPRLNFQVEPKQRTALFWHNILPNGERIAAMEHAACPVMLGSKWIANKWFGIKGQIFS